MLTATLGGLIKDFRIKKRLSQLEVSLRIGWKDATRLSKIEQGRVGKPTRETIDKIMDALDLKGPERAQLLLSSGLIPSYEESIGVIKYLKTFMDGYNYPVSLIDYAWNIYYFNKEAIEVFNLNPETAKKVNEGKLHWLELLFEDGYADQIEIEGSNSDLKLKPFVEHLIALFKYEHQGNSNERWYRNILSRLSKKPQFLKLWKNVEPYSQEHLLYEFELNTFEGEFRGKKQKLSFNIFNIHTTIDFRFYVTIQQPADEETFRFYKKN